MGLIAEQKRTDTNHRDRLTRTHNTCSLTAAIPGRKDWIRSDTEISHVSRCFVMRTCQRGFNGVMEMRERKAKESTMAPHGVTTTGKSSVLIGEHGCCTFYVLLPHPHPPPPPPPPSPLPLLNGLLFSYFRAELGM